MKTISLADFLNAIASITNAAPGSVALEMPLAQLPRWDSLAVLDFIAMADERCGLEIAAGDLRGCKSVSDLAKLFGNQIVR